MTGRQRVLAHLMGDPVDHLPLMPITMRYAAKRIGAKYRDYETDYRVLVEGQLKVAEDFGFDYVNTMSDPGIEAADCGQPVLFYEDDPAGIDHSRSLLAEKETLLTLKAPDPTAPGRMLNRIQAVAHFRERAGDSLIVEGWVEGPCAEAADLRGINTLMLDFVDDPDFVRDLFEFVIEMELRFAREQVKAGCDLIGIGDAAASLVGPRVYHELVWPYEKRLVDGIREMGVGARLHICGNTRRIVSGMSRLGCAIVDLDFLVPLAEARADAGPDQVLLGNMDPVRVLQDSSPEGVYKVLEECHQAAGSRFVVGPGCEVTPDTPEENLRAMTAYAREHAP